MSSRPPLPPHPATVAQKRPSFGGRPELPPHPATVAQARPAFGGRPELPPHPATVVQRLPAPAPLAPLLRDPTAAARGMERRAHVGLQVLTPATYGALDTRERYLWLVRANGAGGVEMVVARRGRDAIGHPTLAFVGAPGTGPGAGAFRQVLIGGEMRYSTGIIGASGWILDNESGRFGRPGTPAQNQASLQFALDLFKHQSGAVAYGDLLSTSAWRRNLQILRREWSGFGTNWLSMGYMVSSNLTWPETLRRWASLGFPVAVAAYAEYTGWTRFLAALATAL